MQEKRKHEFNSWVGKIPEEEMATHSSSCLENSMDRGPGRSQSMELQELDLTEYAYTHQTIHLGFSVRFYGKNSLAN